MYCYGCQSTAECLSGADPFSLTRNEPYQQLDLGYHGEPSDALGGPKFYLVRRVPAKAQPKHCFFEVSLRAD